MRERIVSTLDSPEYPRLLVYLMGPYKAFDPEDLLPEDVDTDEAAAPFFDWDDAAGDYTHADVQALLERTRDRLRDEVGVNAFLAIDVDVPLDEMDAATQTIRFARASNVVALIAPRVGKNLGVGIETGSVLEALDGTHRERVVFVHEQGVRSAMIDALSRRWEATVVTYADENELLHRLRVFIAQVWNAEYAGDIPPLEE